MIPNLSFSGHLAGIVAGTMQVYGWCNPCIVKEQFFLQLDQQQRHISSYPTFVPTNTSSALFTSSSSSSSHSCGGNLPSRIKTVITSIQQSVRRRFTNGISNIDDDDDDDDERNGLLSNTATTLLPSSSFSKEQESLIV